MYISNGSSEIINRIFELFLQKGDTVYLSNPGWPYYRSAADLIGANIHQYNLDIELYSFHYNVHKICEDIKKIHPKVIVITSPNAPTGTLISNQELEFLLDHYKDGIVLLDEAYYGFTLKYQFKEAELLSKYPNLIILRTFSKLYGLASLRIGYLLCDEQIKTILDKVSQPFGISILSQKVAKQALDDIEYYKKLTEDIVDIREDFFNKVNKIKGLKAFKSESNFIIINTSIWSSEDIVQYCKERGYLISNCKKFGLENYVRITIGKKEHMEHIVQILGEYTKKCC